MYNGHWKTTSYALNPFKSVYTHIMFTILQICNVALEIIMLSVRLAAVMRMKWKINCWLVSRIGVCKIAAITVLVIDIYTYLDVLDVQILCA